MNQPRQNRKPTPEPTTPHAPRGSNAGIRWGDGLHAYVGAGGAHRRRQPGAGIPRCRRADGSVRIRCGGHPQRAVQPVSPGISHAELRQAVADHQLSIDCSLENREIKYFVEVHRFGLYTTEEYYQAIESAGLKLVRHIDGGMGGESASGIDQLVAIKPL